MNCARVCEFYANNTQPEHTNNDALYLFNFLNKKKNIRKNKNISEEKYILQTHGLHDGKGFVHLRVIPSFTAGRIGSKRKETNSTYFLMTFH